MKTQNQYVILGLFHSGTIKVRPETGEILTKKGKPYSGSQLNGYWQHTFKLSGDYQIGVFAHNIVYLWVYGAYKPELVIDHKDHNRGNNCISNLRAITQSENLQYEPNRKIGENSHFYARVTLENRYAILQSTREGESQLKIAKKYNITRQTVSRIVKEEWSKYEQSDKREWLNFNIQRKRQ